MNENAKKWVAALRSRKYKQTKGTLRKGNSFCCLGVACDLYAKEFSEKWHSNFCHFKEFMGTETYLPRKVADWLGINDIEGEFCNEMAQLRSLADLNDRGDSFAEIADIIESEPEDLFREDS